LPDAYDLPAALECVLDPIFRVGIDLSVPLVAPVKREGPLRAANSRCSRAPLSSCMLRNSCAAGTAPERHRARLRRLCCAPPATPAPCQAPGPSQQPWLQPRACQPPPAGQAQAAGQHPRAQPSPGAQAACRTSRRAFDGELTLEGLRDGGYFDMPIQVRAAREAGSPVPCTPCRSWCGWRPAYQRCYWKLTLGATSAPT